MLRFPIVSTAIVTGAPGWLGTHLVRALVLGLEDVEALRAPPSRRVRCLVQRGVDTTELTAISKDAIEIVHGDVTDPGSLEALFADAEGATLFHAAAIIHPTQGAKQFFRVNTDGTRNVLTQAIAARVRRIVHVSSNSPIGANARNGDVFDESSPYAPYMSYGKSKMIAERAVRDAGEREEIEAVVIRPPWFYGPGQPRRQSLFFEMIRDGKAPIVGGGENRRSMAFVDNICQGALLCESVAAAKNQVYWIADRKPYSMNEIIDTIERVLEMDFGVKVAHKRMRLPGIASEVAWSIDWMLQRAGLYQQKIHVLSEMNKTIACSIGKAERELGYDPKVALEEGMRRSIRFMLDRGDKL
jgi:nucleoside-diphosphate-sugar epimerase